MKNQSQFCDSEEFYHETRNSTYLLETNEETLAQMEKTCEGTRDVSIEDVYGR